MVVHSSVGGAELSVLLNAAAWGATVFCRFDALASETTGVTATWVPAPKPRAVLFWGQAKRDLRALEEQMRSWADNKGYSARPSIDLSRIDLSGLRVPSREEYGWPSADLDAREWRKDRRQRAEDLPDYFNELAQLVVYSMLRGEVYDLALVYPKDPVAELVEMRDRVATVVEHVARRFLDENDRSDVWFQDLRADFNRRLPAASERTYRDVWYYGAFISR